jgi:hypothetical protein
MLRRWRPIHVKKLLLLAAAVGGALFVVRRQRAAKADSDLWQQATKES